MEQKPDPDDKKRFSRRDVRRDADVDNDVIGDERPQFFPDPNLRLALEGLRVSFSLLLSCCVSVPVQNVILDINNILNWRSVS